MCNAILVIALLATLFDASSACADAVDAGNNGDQIYKEITFFVIAALMFLGGILTTLLSRSRPQTGIAVDTRKETSSSMRFTPVPFYGELPDDFVLYHFALYAFFAKYAYAFVMVHLASLLGFWPFMASWFGVCGACFYLSTVVVRFARYTYGSFMDRDKLSVDTKLFDELKAINNGVTFISAGHADVQTTLVRNFATLSFALDKVANRQASGKHQIGFLISTDSCLHPFNDVGSSLATTFYCYMQKKWVELAWNDPVDTSFMCDLKGSAECANCIEDVINMIFLRKYRDAADRFSIMADKIFGRSVKRVFIPEKVRGIRIWFSDSGKARHWFEHVDHGALGEYFFGPDSNFRCGILNIWIPFRFRSEVLFAAKEIFKDENRLKAVVGSDIMSLVKRCYSNMGGPQNWSEVIRVFETLTAPSSEGSPESSDFLAIGLGLFKMNGKNRRDLIGFSGNEQKNEFFASLVVALLVTSSERALPFYEIFSIFSSDSTLADQWAQVLLGWEA